MTAAAATTAMTAMTADPALVRRVLAESGVDRTPVPPETSYLGEVITVVQRAVLKALEAGLKRLDLPVTLVAVVAWGLAAVGVLLVAWVALSWWRRRRRAKDPGAGSVAALEIPPSRRTAAAWRAELDRRLFSEGAEGRIAEALEALWWWLARSLAGDRAEPNWTTRDLVARARREDSRDLRDLVRRLDAFTYGPHPPAVDDLRRLVGRLEEALA